MSVEGRTDGGPALCLAQVGKTFGRHRALIDLTVRFASGDRKSVV